MDLRLLDPADSEGVRRAAELFELVRAAETPELAPVPEARYSGALQHPPPDSECRCYTAEHDGTLLGLLWLYLPLKENAHYAEAELVVHPDHRRRGIGSALLDRLLELARAEGRSELIVMARAAVEGGPGRPDAGPRFLERHGFKAALTEIDRGLRVGALAPEAEERLFQEALAAAEGYELVSWIGRCPEEYLEGLGRIDSQIFAEIPLGDVDLRPRTVDAQFIRTREARAEAQGDSLIRTIAVRGGEVAANTLIYTHEGQEHADQAITIVDPAHRGHRLGLLVKLANLRQLREHFGHVHTVWTGNADTNANMAAINDLLGYRPVDARVSYKLQRDA
ncbi:GNAT family N-acetyltransferase [Glycomyces harbinensis]|uniref:Acetyltransferase (GNAT) family protein n=1 Tax=Glycomyces harbinensis TaxID=58114 RepID=A0A1G6WFN2_9ACTN|nr:GNAT family N-acetyltransferase [Glycomyces harbinensis]SDD64641.1 Acetyltransferase (GNAT) family protein [Glycomyces harbinensis]